MWTFPETATFDIVVGGVEFINCRLLALDNEHATIERDWIIGMGRVVRLKTQFALSEIKAIHEHAIIGQAEERRSAEGAAIEETR